MENLKFKGKLMNIKLVKGINDEDITRLLDWSNKKGLSFIEQWAGKGFEFPLKQADIIGIRDSTYSIFKDDEFVGIIQKIWQDSTNVHIGRFVINPEHTSKGIGKSALKLFCELLFKEKDIMTISLNVLSNNESAVKLYNNLGFEIMGKGIRETTKFYKMVLKK